MAVYVDDMHEFSIGYLRGMKMSHMIADTHEELIAMVDRIGVSRKWIQSEGMPDEHFDISKSKRDLAVKHGAQEITMRTLAAMIAVRRIVRKKGLI